MEADPRTAFRAGAGQGPHQAHRRRFKPTHSFASLLADLATVCANRVQPTDSGLAGFTIITTLTPLQRRAFELLGVSHRLGHA